MWHILNAEINSLWFQLLIVCIPLFKKYWSYVKNQTNGYELWINIYTKSKQKN